MVIVNNKVMFVIVKLIYNLVYFFLEWIKYNKVIILKIVRVGKK